MKKTHESANAAPESQREESHEADVADVHRDGSNVDNERAKRIEDLRVRLAAGSYHVSSSDIAGKLMKIMADETKDAQLRRSSEPERERS